MIKIILSEDPFFSVQDKQNVIHWISEDIEENFNNLMTAMEEKDEISVPFAEKLFIDDVFALSFIEENRKKGTEVSLYCKRLTLPEILQQYASIEVEKKSYHLFYGKIESLPFSPKAMDIVKENIKGLPYSGVEHILTEIAEMDENIAINHLLEQKRNLLRQNSVLEVVKIEENIDDIGGLQDLKQWITSRKDNFSEKARSFGIPMPKGVLLLGVQGCGKSLTAKIIANIWNFPLVRLDFINLFAKGKSVEEQLREAINIAENFAPIVLWIDEIEKALSQEEQTSEIRRILGWLMTWMQEKTVPVFLVATANRVSVLPPELLRKGRFDEIFFVDLPTTEERKEIFKIHIEKRKREIKNFDIPKLSNQSSGFSGAEIEMAVIDALTNEFTRGKDLSQKSVEEAIRKTVPLSVTYEEEIKHLRIWSKDRARNASGNKRIETMFKST